MINYKLLLKVYSDGDDTISYNAVNELIHAAYQIAQSAHPICCLPDNILAGVAKAAVSYYIFVNLVIIRIYKFN